MSSESFGIEGKQALILSTTLIVALLSIATFSVYISPLRKIPGPFWASVSPLWRIWYVIQGDWHRRIITLHKRHGKLVRIAPNEISITSSSAIQTGYGHSGQAWVKEDWYKTWWVPNATHGFFAEIEPTKHRDLRRRVSKVYSMSYILKMEEYIDGIVELLLHQLSVRDGQKIDLTDWTQFFTFDVVGDLAFGKSFGLLDSGSDVDGLANTVYLLLSSQAALGWTWFRGRAVQYKLVRWLLNRSYLTRVGKKLTCNPRPVLEKIVRTKMTLRPSTDRQDLLSEFLQMKNPDGSPLHPRDPFGESMNVVAAGADTVAISLRAVIRFVASSPRVYRTLQKEINESASLDKLSRLVTYAEGSRLPYLQAVIKEAMRLWPAVGYQLPRIVPPGGAEIDGVFLPGGTCVSLNAWSLHRDPDIFGADAEEFRPERWLSPDSPEQLKQMEQCFASFGFGSRTCIGKNLAMVEMSKLLPVLFRDFEFEICDPEKPWDVSCAWFVYQSHFFAKVHRRQMSS